MKKISIVLMSLLLLVGCSNGQVASTQEPTSEPTSEPTATPEETNEPSTVDTSTVKVLTPSGAPSLSTIPLIKEGYDVEVVDGPDMLQAAFVNPSPEYDVIIAPTNLGMKLATAGKTDYRLMAIVTWGNFYLVANDEKILESTDLIKVGAFGEQAVSGLVFNKLYPQYAEQVEWYASVAECAAALTAGNIDLALLAEPVATATIAKNKENGKDLFIVADLQKEWSEAGQGFPQAGLFVRSENLKDNLTFYEQMIVSMQQYTFDTDASSSREELVKDIETITPEVLGVPSAQIISKVWPRMNIHVDLTDTHVEELQDFLKLFGIEDIAPGLYSTIVD